MRVFILFRRLFNPLLYFLARLVLYRGRLPKVWTSVRDLPEDEFFREINKYPWLPDPLWQVFDFTNVNPDLFFSTKPEFPWWKERRTGRDCDDFADLIFRWARHRGYPAWVIVLHFGFYRNGHAICIFKKDDKYVLADYWPKGEFDSLDEAMEWYASNNRSPHGKMRWWIYRSSA